MTEWRSIDGFPKYLVSSDGRIRHRKKSRCLSPRPTVSGHEQVALFNDSGRSEAFIHRVVIETFVGPPPTSEHQTNHIDGDKSNNAVENLEWVTPKENMRHAWRNGLCRPLRGEDNGNARIDWDGVRAMRAEYASGNITIKDLADKYGMSETQTHRIIKNKCWVEDENAAAYAWKT